MLRDKAARIWCWSVAGMWRITQPADRRAVTAIEYAIIAGVLAAVIVVSVTAIGPELSNTFNKAATPL
jgi:Flp pilus assembly pilin Flp